MDKEITYKGHTAKLTIKEEHYHSFIHGFGHTTRIHISSPYLRCASETLMNEDDAELIEEIYTAWFKQSVDELLP